MGPPTLPVTWLVAPNLRNIMANQKSKYSVTLYLRLTPYSKAWVTKQVPERFPSFAAYVDYLIKKDKKARDPKES